MRPDKSKYIALAFDLFYKIVKIHKYACKYQNSEPKVDGFIKRVEHIWLIEKNRLLWKKLKKY